METVRNFTKEFVSTLWQQVSVVKEEGKENDLLERIAADSAFGMTMEQLQAIMKPENFVGRSPEQTVEFITEYVQPVLDENKDILGMKAEINV